MPLDLSPLWVSLKTALVATGLAFLLGLAAARWMLTYSSRGKRLLDGLFTLPLVLPPTVVGFLLLWLLGKNSPVGQLLNTLGIAVIFTWGATAIAATIVAFPLMYKTVLGAFEQIDTTLLSSARTLGASEWRIFWQILLPLAWPGVLAGTVLAFARALGEFGATLMVGGSIPGVSQTIPIAIFFAAEGGRMGVALVWVLLMVAVSLGIMAAIHAGPSAQTSGNRLLRWGFNGLYFRRFSDRGFGLAPLGRSPKPFGGSHSRPRVSPPGRGRRLAIASRLARGGVAISPQVELLQPQPQPWREPLPALAQRLEPNLTVHIQTQLPNFQLRVNFQAGSTPLGLLGASGSGKSLTLRSIAGLETPSQGRIVLNGRVLFDAAAGVNLPSRDRKVGLVFQNYALFPHLTVAQNIAFGMAAVPPSQRAAQVVDYLDQMDLSGLGDRYPAQLSGGQQQRVALARALASQPDILLMDEPLSALDTYLRSHIEKRLVEVLARYQGVTLFITHKLEEAYRLCPNLLVLSEGRILAHDTREAIFARPPSYAVARVTECKNFSRARPVGDGSVEALDWGCQLQVSEPIPPDLMHLGIRAHHLQFAQTLESPNTFPGWLAMITETQHKVTLYLKLHSAPQSPQDYHLQAEVYREKWEQLSDRPGPWPIHLDSNRLIMMRE
jgi:molybdate transport system permease protein